MMLKPKGHTKNYLEILYHLQFTCLLGQKYISKPFSFNIPVTRKEVNECLRVRELQSCTSKIFQRYKNCWKGKLYEVCIVEKIV